MEQSCTLRTFFTLSNPKDLENKQGLSYKNTQGSLNLHKNKYRFFPDLVFKMASLFI